MNTTKGLYHILHLHLCKAEGWTFTHLQTISSQAAYIWYRISESLSSLEGNENKLSVMELRALLSTLFNLIIQRNSTTNNIFLCQNVVSYFISQCLLYTKNVNYILAMYKCTNVIQGHTNVYAKVAFCFLK